MLSIVAKDIHVEFPIYDVRSRSLKQTFGLGPIAKGFSRLAGRNLNVGGQIGTGERGRVVVKALDGLSFEIHEGDRIGLFGHNGSGKTTLLRTLAGIYEPASGDIKAVGRVVALFDLHVGMDFDATGIENIWMRGKLLGMTTQQIKDSIPDIDEFTGLGGYLEMPMRTYSAGMMLRLAFGISTALTPEILILDEVIGAGDAAFISRANDRLKGFLERAGILVLASHGIPTLRRWCNKGMLLERGKLVAFGPFDDIAARYEEMMKAKASGQS